jgi:tetratricopeptide (TPR) repeat protein
MAKSQSKRASTRPKSPAKLPPSLAKLSRALESLDIPDVHSDAELAQELFYDALDAPSAAKRRKLLEQALVLDPRHADVRLCLLDEQTTSPAARIDALRAIVADAALALGPDFNAMAGHFWGFHETRPYMRAREQLAIELHAAGRWDEAIVEYRDMLALNPNDNQGLRYELRPLLLSLGRVDDSRALALRYPNDETYNAAFAWCLVLECLLAKESDSAAAALAAARKVNPHLEPYINGRERIPAEQPGSYSPGSPSEAVCFAESVRSAWSSHPEALRWLQSRN